MIAAKEREEVFEMFVFGTGIMSLVEQTVLMGRTQSVSKEWKTE
jgi:hypothetical protein